MTYVGTLIREKRTECGLTQRQISNKLKLTTAQYISNVERGLCPLSYKMAKKICKILKIDLQVMAQSMFSDYAHDVARAFNLKIKINHNG